jgi:hypothetical protein
MAFLDDDGIPEIETFTPEEMGWVRVGPRQWETPDGQLYIFPPDVPEVIQRLLRPHGSLMDRTQFPQERIDEIVAEGMALMREVEERMARERASGLRCLCCNTLLTDVKPKWCPECGGGDG